MSALPGGRSINGKVFVCLRVLVSPEKICSKSKNHFGENNGEIGMYADYDLMDNNIVFPLEKLQENLKGKHIKAVARHGPTAILEEKMSKHNSLLQTAESQMAIKIFTDLRDSFLFHGTVIEGGDYVSTHLNGTPKTKPALMITSGEADIAILQSVLRPEIALTMSFLHPTLDVGKVTAFFKDPPEHFSYNFYTDPFSEKLWYAFVFTWMSILVVFLLSIKLLRKARMKHYRRFAKSMSYFDAISWVISFITQQGWKIDSSTLYFNLLVLISRFTFTVVYGVYCGAIVSVLSQGGRVIETFEDLLQHKFVLETYDSSASMGSYLKDLISDKGLLQKAILVNKSQVMSSLEDSSPHKAFLYYWPSFYQITRNSNILDWVICAKISAVPIELTPTRSAMLVKKNFEYRELFNYKIIQLKERGMNHRYRVAHDRDGFPLCPKENRGRQTRNLGLHEVHLSVVIVFVAILFALVILVLELVVSKLRNKPEHTVNDEPESDDRY